MELRIFIALRQEKLASGAHFYYDRDRRVMKMSQYVYQTQGTCARSITVDLDGKKIRSVSFEGGCNGNLKGISKLVQGMDMDFVIGRFEGNTCGNKPTSCPDQLAKALREAYAAQVG